MSKSFKKRAASFLLAALMMVEMLPLTTLHAHAAGTNRASGDHTDLAIDFNYQSDFADAEAALRYEANQGFDVEELTKDEAEDLAWVQIYDGDLKREGGKFRQVMESTDPDEKYIVLSQDVDLRYGSGEWKPIKITSDKVLDLNGFTLNWWDKTNKEDGENWQSTNIYDHYEEKYFIKVDSGATLTIIDSSAAVNGYDTGKGTGKIVAGAQIIDAFEQQLDYYTQRDLFVVDGNLVIYGGTFQAGFQKDQYKSKFSWDKLADCLGKTLDLGLSIAEYATGLDAASAALKDLNDSFKTPPAQGNTSDTGENGTNDSSTQKPTGAGGTQNQTVDTPASAGSADNSQDRAQTVTERNETDSANNNANNNTTGGSSNQTNGQNQANSKGTAKNDKNSKIAAEEKKVVQAALDKEKIMDMWDKGAAVVNSITSMIGNAEGTRVTQTIWGTVAKVNTNGTLVVYDGTLQGHGSSPNLRNAVVEMVRLGEHGEDKQKSLGGRAYIFGGIFEGYSGANVFNTVRAPKTTQTGAARAFTYSAKDHEVSNITYLTETGTHSWTVESENVTLNGSASVEIAYPYTYDLDASETNNVEVLHYENQDAVAADTTDTVEPIPIDTSNVIVRGGTFRTYSELANEGARLPYMKEFDPTGEGLTFMKFTGTSGSVNLGLESFGEDMIRDGRIQLNDVYGDGSLVLMDEEVDEAHPAGLKHYRLYCGDTELRHIRYLDVFPMNAGANSTHSFSLQTYYGQTNLSNISTWNTENDEENLHTAPFAGDEYFFDYEFDGRDARDYYVMPNLNGEIYDTSMQDSEAWYYPEPVDSKGNPIPDFASTIPMASFEYKGVSYVAPTHYMKDLYIFDEGDYDDFSPALYYSYTNDSYRENLKWFRYRVYRVDPITRENISESDTFGVDEPLAEVVYGVAEDDAMRCKLDLYDLSQYLIEKTKDSDEPWTGYKQGELYRIVFNVDEHVNYGYTGDDLASDEALSFDYESQVGDNWSVKNTYERQGESFAGIMPVASTESSVLFRCSSASEQSELPNTDASSNIFFDTDYTPLQFGSYAVLAGKEATINFVNAKVSQCDNTGDDFISVYYQWYVSDDAIVDRDASDPTKVTDTLLAGMTNINMDWNTSSDHKPEKWNPDADKWDYRNTLSPDDPHYEEYGEDGLPDNPEYWTMYDLHAYTTEMRQNELCIRPEYLEGLDEEELAKVNLTMQNNNPFAFNTDSCYIPEEAAGKYVYVRAIVTNLKDEYTKIYDKKQVFYSHPMLVIDDSMLIADTQEPAMDFSYQSGSDGAYVSKDIYATVGQDKLFGFTGTALPADMKKEGYEIRLSQKVYDRYDGDVVYQADNGDTINLKNFIFEPGQYYVEQTQELFYKRPYWSDTNNFREAIIEEEFVASRIDRFPVTVDLALPESISLDYPRTGFEVGEQITITATTEPEGDYWYRWLLDGPGALDEMTILQDSQSNVLKYTFTDETPQRFWVQVYSKDAEGNESVNCKDKITGEIFPGDQMVVTTYVNGEEIVSANNYSATVHLEKGSDAVMSVEVAGGRGEYTYRAYNRRAGQYYDNLIGNTSSITIDTSAVGKTDYVIRVDDGYTEGAYSLRLYVNVHETLAITSAREAQTVINQPTWVNLWAKYVGYDVYGQMQEKVNGSWKNMTDVEWETSGDCNVRVSTVGTHEYRVVLTDYFGNQEMQYFTVVYDNSVPQEIAADGAGTLIFRKNGDSEFKKSFTEGDDIIADFTDGFIYDPADDTYSDEREYFMEKNGLEVKPVTGDVTVKFSLCRYDDPADAYFGLSGGELVYGEAGFNVSDYGTIRDDFTFDTSDGLPDNGVNLVDGTYMTPGYYYMSMTVYNSGVIAGGGTGSNNNFSMSGSFEVLPAGEEHVHDYTFYAKAIDTYTHYKECICGDRIEENHYYTDYEIDEPWSPWGVLYEVNGSKYTYMYSGVEQRLCDAQYCWAPIYRWRFVEEFDLEESIEIGYKEEHKLEYTTKFKESISDAWFSRYPDYYTEEEIANFQPPNNKIIWESSDESIATVDEEGNVTAVGVGTAIITGTTVQPSYVDDFSEGGPALVAQCTVTVGCEHKAANLIPATASTCSVAGCIEHYKCAECGNVSLNGTFTDGKTLEDVTLPLADHEPSGVWNYDETGHYHGCKYNCGHQYDEVVAHTFNVDAADCNNAKYCTVCRYEAEAQLEHDMTYKAAVKRDCDTAGVDAHYYCSDCGGYFLDEEGEVSTTLESITKKALGHSYKKATCTTAKTCIRCGGTDGDPLGHTWTEATCQNPKTCSVCLVTQGSKLAHDYDPATCTEDGVCSMCNTVIEDATGHNYVDGQCSVCGEAEPSVPGTDVTVETAGTISYTVSGNTVTVTNDKACKVGYLVDGAYVKITGTKNADGSYSFTVPDGVTSVLVAINGDVNGDGTVNSADKSVVARSLLATTHKFYKVLDTTQLFVADVNGDGTVNSADKSVVARSLLATTHKFYKVLAW